MYNELWQNIQVLICTKLSNTIYYIIYFKVHYIHYSVQKCIVLNSMILYSKLYVLYLTQNCILYSMNSTRQCNTICLLNIYPLNLMTNNLQDLTVTAGPDKSVVIQELIILYYQNLFPLLLLPFVIPLIRPSYVSWWKYIENVWFDHVCM